jgi:alpha-2-macroglobulin
VSPLSVEVQEDGPSGQVRVTVKNVSKDAYVSEVQAKVIGSRNDDLVSGATDLRGVFVAQGVPGTSTVIAETDAGRYAFFRGTTELGPPPEPAKPANTAPQAEKPQSGNRPGNGLLDNVQSGNSKIQIQNAKCSKTSTSRTRAA